MPESAAVQHARGEAHVAEPLHRPWMAGACTTGVLAVLVVGFLALPREGAPLPAIARYAMTIALPDWKITEPVNEIVYGTRGFDTLGETFLLIAAVVSVATLARHRVRRAEYVGEEEAGRQEQRESDPDRSGRTGGGAEKGGDGAGGVTESEEELEARRAEAEEAGEDTVDAEAGTRDGHGGRVDMPGSRREPFAADTTPLGSTAPEHSEAMTVIVRVAARAAVPILAVAAIYLCARGFSPGGGFPAGAALSGVGMLLYAALGYRAVAPVVRPAVLEPIELLGAAIIVGLAVAGWFLRGSVMANWIPLAPVQTIASGGLLQAFSVMELVEVATGLSIAVFAMLAMRHDWTPDEQNDPGQGSGDGRPGSRARGKDRSR